MAHRWHVGVHQQFLHQQFTSYNALHTMQTLSSIAVRSFLTPTAWENVILPKITSDTSADRALPAGQMFPSITCFRDDDPPLPEYLSDKDINNVSLRTKLEIRYSPWAMSMMDGFGKIHRGTAREFTGGPTGGGRGDDDDGGGEGGGGGGDEGGDEQIYFLPLLTIAFAAFHLGYCIAVWMKDDSLDFEFFRTGVGLFCLLALAAIRLNYHTGLDAHVLGLGASVGVMLWTGERCFVKKEGSPAGIVTLFAATMAVMFTIALCDNI